MIGILARIVRLIVWLLKAVLIAHCVVSWVHPSENKWTVLLRRIVEPVLSPIRTFLVRKLPPRWQILDWSPVVAYLLIELAGRFVISLLAIFI